MSRGKAVLSGGMAMLMAGVIGAAGCKDRGSSAPTVKAPAGMVGPTTQEAAAEPVRVDVGDLEPIASLGVAVAAKGPDGTMWEKYSSGLMVQVQKLGTGRLPEVGQTVSVAYVGTLPETGVEFDRSPKDEPLAFRLGTRGIIKGWNMVVAAMKAGGKCKVLIPAELAYGSRGFPPKFGPNQALVFEMELVSIKGEGVSLPAATTSAATMPRMTEVGPAKN